jgi:NADH-quinone oxidoreductase subunit G
MSLGISMAIIFIDDKAYTVKNGGNVLETCLSLGLNLPYFCWHPAMHSVGACRQCGILKYKDEADKKGRLVMACMEPVADKMRIAIEAPEARLFRATNVEALMTNHPHDCPVCDEGGECHLQDMTVMTGHNYRRFHFKKRTHNNQYLGPFVNHEMNRCIQCYRCVRFYKDYAGGKDLDVFSAHDEVYFGRQEEGVLENEFSGNLVEVCPTGVFTDKTLKKHFTRKWDLTNAPSICHGCSVGCNIIASERYGSIRRILTRFNGDVNGYFLCDRGRFGYEYVNSARRITRPLKQKDGAASSISPAVAIREIRAMTAMGKKMIGIGSPRASLESNFLLRQWVGADNFFAGIPQSEGKLVGLVTAILQTGAVRTPSLGEVKDYDAVFIVGEDVTNTAPMLALSLRQAAKNKPGEAAKALKIADWNDAAVREVVQDACGPFYIASPHVTRLDQISTLTYRAHPDMIARLAYGVAHLIDDRLPPTALDTAAAEKAASVAAALLAAKKPLIVSGTGLDSEAIIRAAAGLATALSVRGKDVGLVYVVPEANSMGLSMLGGGFLEEAFEAVRAGSVGTAIILENDLYRRMDKNTVDAFFSRCGQSVVLDSLENATTLKATYVLPAGTFAEADGTLVNNEGRAQRFYRVHIPDNDVRSSWQWLDELSAVKPGQQVAVLDGIVDRLAAEFPELSPVRSLAPPADFREGTQKIPREPHRYSGRTAMHADKDVNEPKPPIDADSALSFTMEGYAGIPPSADTPYYWSPGWNSVQAINKYQIEVGGPLHGGNPGIRLFEPGKNGDTVFGAAVPPLFAPRAGQWFILPLYHIFGSDELSALSPAVKERVPAPYIALNDVDAGRAGIREGQIVELSFNGARHRLVVRLRLGLPEGTAGLPKGLAATAGIGFPFWTTLQYARE